MAKKTKSAKKAAKAAKKAAKKAEKSKTKVDRRSQPPPPRMLPETSMAKPSVAPPGPPVPLRGHCETPSKSSPLRL